MTDYTKLVAALQNNDWSDACPCCDEAMCKDADCIILQAADAIEALQAQLPKRGKWVELDYQPNVHEIRYRCSLCGRQVLILSGSGELLKTYPYCHCGAKMEAQDDKV